MWAVITITASVARTFVQWWHRGFHKWDHRYWLCLFCAFSGGCCCTFWFARCTFWCWWARVQKSIWWWDIIVGVAIFFVVIVRSLPLATSKLCAQACSVHIAEIFLFDDIARSSFWRSIRRGWTTTSKNSYFGNPMRDSFGCAYYGYLLVSKERGQKTANSNVTYLPCYPVPY